MANGKIKALPKTRITKFKKVISSVSKGATIWILIARIDPDAIGAALGLWEIIQRLVEGKNVAVKITYCGDVGHRQNQTIVNLHDLNSVMFQLDSVKVGKKDRFFLVDSHLMKDSRILEKYSGARPLGIIDHHICKPAIKEGAGQFIMVDSGATSCCTLISELARKISFQFSDRAKLLLSLGIHNDSHEMVDANARDYFAHSVVSEDVNSGDFFKLTKYDLPAYHFKYLCRALTKLKPDHGRIIATVGFIKKDEGDTVASIADALFPWEGAVLVVVWGVVENEYVRISVRCKSSAIDLASLLKKHFPDKSGVKINPNGQSGGADVTLENNPWKGKGKEYLKGLAMMISGSIKESFSNE